MGLATQVLTHLAAGETALAALADALGRDKKDIVKAAQILKRRGLLARVDGSGPRAYALTVAGQRRAEQGQAICSGQGRKPRQKTIGLRERAWWEVRTHHPPEPTPTGQAKHRARAMATDAGARNGAEARPPSPGLAATSA